MRSKSVISWPALLSLLGIVAASHSAYANVRCCYVGSDEQILAGCHTDESEKEAMKKLDKDVVYQRTSDNIVYWCKSTNAQKSDKLEFCIRVKYLNGMSGYQKKKSFDIKSLLFTKTI